MGYLIASLVLVLVLVCFRSRTPQIPVNGLVIYCGTIMTAEGKEKQVTIDFEPFKPINTSLYLCDNKFHTQVPSAWCCCRRLSFPLLVP